MALTQSPTSARITYVDGIRGVAIAMVLVFHGGK